LTRRNHPGRLAEKIDRLNRQVMGWTGYFRYIRSGHALEQLDQWLRRKVRVIKLKQLKRNYTIYKFLRSRGVAEQSAWALALSGKGWWRKSGCPQTHQAMSRKWFEEQGLVSLKVRWRQLQDGIVRNRLGAEQACRVV